MIRKMIRYSKISCVILGAGLLIMICAGCASVPARRPDISYAKKEFLELGAFCKKYQLEFNFDTLDDTIRLSSSSVDLRLLLSSQVAYYNGRIVSLERTPRYSRGIIFIPSELESIFAAKKETFREMLLPATVKTVVLDPGHGGKDPGAISRTGLKEKDINLKVARYLKSELEAEGLKVYLTRDSDKYLTLKERVEFARKCDADIFISIHANANRSRKVKGFEVYYLSDKYFDSASKAVVLAENASFGFDEHYFSKSTRQIVWDLICTENNTVSLNFASTLITTFKRMGVEAKPPRGAPFYVLKYAYIPSVLVEMGYLSNTYEEKLLRKSYYLKQIAHGIALSVKQFNRRYARKGD